MRSAGFPADMVLAICDEPLARSADLAGTDPAGRLAYDTVYADAAGRVSGAIASIHADPRFQEAVTWQNPGLAQRLRDAGVGTSRRSKDRGRELVVASYLQRYCLKNDTIGFFGPVGWASAGQEVPGLVVVPGEQLLARRTTYFEVWAIDKVAAEIARQGRALGWLRPRRTRSVFLDGNVLHRPYRRPVTLTDAELQILQACDGSRTINEVVDSAGVPEARALLARLAELEALRLDLEGPMHAWPERLLREKLELIADPAARAAALEPVDQMIRARDAVAGAAGDPARLRKALAGLAETFEQVTGAPSTRRAGANYAGRTLVYQDAVRDVRVEVGEAVTRALARPLGLVLDSVRWLVNDITGRYRVLFAELLDREMARAGGGPVPLQRLLTVASPYLSTVGRGVGELAASSVAELQRRWQQVLGPPQSPSRHQVSADTITARAAECFPAHPVTWSGARQHSPDIMIAAASPAEVKRGNFLLILGEIHLATNTLDQRLFAGQHPDPARLIAAEQADRGPRRIVLIPAKDHPNVTSRTSPPSAILGPGQLYWSAAITDSFDPPDSDIVMPGAAMTVTSRGEDLVVQVAPSGAELDFFEVIGDEMVEVVLDAFQPAAPAAHRPRITIDRFVLSREQWRFQTGDSAWAFAKDEQERFYLARCWRQEHGLPERVFYRVPVELKPAAADFRSIVLVNLFAKHIRQTQAAGHTQYTVTEMLPDLDQLWLTDRQGRRYSSELRIIAYDSMTEDHPSRDGRNEDHYDQSPSASTVRRERGTSADTG
ncbi:MAG TPA: lantibiotic dehydratase [Streptosporangiaceae bacterium]|nr:lantibiotic dehydratase [Streptosporangiaceae bacterium]